MSILHVVENLERGGLERVVIDLAIAQHEAGERCRVACVFQRGALAGELERRGIRVDACGKRGGLDLVALLRLRRLLRDTEGGILHTHNAAAHYHALTAGRGLRFRRVVNTRHGMGSGDPQGRRERRYRSCMPRTDVVAAVCEVARLGFDAQGVAPRGALLSVSNGIRGERFLPADGASRGRLRQALGLDPDARIVGTVGRLNWAKDQKTLLAAFARVRAKIPGVALVLVGDGELRDELEATVAGSAMAGAVHFLGDRGDVAELLRGFDLFALSSVTEGCSIALLEACATALPIVATRVGGNAEIVADGVRGRIVAPADPLALADAMIAVLSDPAASLAMATEARRWVLAEGSLSAMAGRYRAIYEGASA